MILHGENSFFMKKNRKKALKRERCKKIPLRDTFHAVYAAD